MELKLYDTLTREKRLFAPLDPERRAHVCVRADGLRLRPYRQCAAGDRVRRAVPAAAPPLRRRPRHLCPQHHRRRRQDQRAGGRARHRDPRRSPKRPTRNFKEDVAALGCLPPTVEPRATEHIEEMKALIERLVASGHAYVAEEHVLFERAVDAGLRQALEALARRDDRRRPRRGRALQARPDGLRAVEAVESRASRRGRRPPGIAAPGRPGWHIECSAMSWKHLGETFDIHGGGIDLVFPHHENEIAQSRCAFHSKVMANFWMHNGFLQVEGEKMAKSARQFRHHPRVAGGLAGRGAAAQHASHALPPADRLDRRRAWKRARRRWTAGIDLLGDMAAPEDAKADAEVLDALGDDLNTPKAMASLHGLAGEIRGPASGMHQIDLKHALKSSSAILGLFEQGEGAYLKPPPSHHRGPNQGRRPR